MNTHLETLDVITLARKSNGSWTVATRNIEAAGLSAADAMDALTTQHSSREASLAKTKIQEAMFWAAQAAGPVEPTKGV